MYALIILAFVIAALIWNFAPQIRKKMVGLSTILEGIIGTVLIGTGSLVEGLKEASEAGWVPAGLEQYLPWVVGAWIVLKRMQTKTPLGKSY